MLIADGASRMVTGAAGDPLAIMPVAISREGRDGKAVLAVETVLQALWHGDRRLLARPAHQRVRLVLVTVGTSGTST